MPVIDFRIRPLYKKYGEGFSDENIRKFMKAWGYTYQGALKDRKMESLIKEMDENDIERAVVPGRLIEDFDNQMLFEMEKEYSGKFIIFPFLNAEDVNESLKTIENDIVNGQGKGASMEPYPLEKAGIAFDDKRLYPIYEKLEKNNIPLLVTVSGLMNSYVNGDIPAQIDRMLYDFPKLRLIAAHAGWPWINEMITVAFKHSNLYLTADFEAAKSPGSDVFRQAAEHMVSEQILFASSFPLGPIGEGIQWIKSWKLPKETEEKILYRNAKEKFSDIWK